MNYLSQLENIDNGYYLYIIHDPTLFKILNEWFRDNQNKKNFEIKSVHQFNGATTKKIILTTQKKSTMYLSLEEMKRLKHKLLNIHNIRNQFETIFILYYLEHAALIQNKNFFPHELSNLPPETSKERIWQVFFLPEIDDINSIEIHPNKENRIFKVFSHCLYEADHYKRVDYEYSVKKNVHYLKLQLNHNLEDQLDIIKYDSIQKIQKEKDNADMILSNLSRDLTYRIRNTFFLNGEHTGAICSCADTFDSETLRDKLLTITDYEQIRSLFSNIFESFNKLYKLNTRHKSYSTVEQYLKRIISVVLEITSVDTPFVKAKDENLTEIDWKDLFEESYKKECFFKLIDIIPDFNDIQRCKLIFEMTVTIDKKPFRCHAFYMEKDPLWREKFNAANLTIGKKYLLKNVMFDNFLSPYYDAMTELFMSQEQDVESTNDADYNQIRYWNELKTMETVQFGENRYVNPGVIVQDTETLMKLTNDQFRLAHGDANLDNIVFLTKPDKNNHQVTFQPFLIDLASLETDYPVSFDMAKLEVEIKNHIVANHILVNYFKTHRKSWISLLFCIEKYLHSETDSKLLYQSMKDLDEETKNGITRMVSLILLIRKKAYELYQKSPTERPSTFGQKVKKRYLQQLFFYSLRTLSYASLEKMPRFYAAISAVCVATEIFSTRDGYSENKERSGHSFLKKNIFISYAHADRKWLYLLVDSLKTLKHKDIDFWYDEKNIRTGDKWSIEIQSGIENAHMAICLISNNFLNSDFIRDKEIPAILNKQHDGLIIFPILIENCMWVLIDWLKKIQMYPKNGIPLCAQLKEEKEKNQSLKTIISEISNLLT